MSFAHGTVTGRASAAPRAFEQSSPEQILEFGSLANELCASLLKLFARHAMTSTRVSDRCQETTRNTRLVSYFRIPRQKLTKLMLPGPTGLDVHLQWNFHRMDVLHRLPHDQRRTFNLAFRSFEHELVVHLQQQAGLELFLA